MQHVSTVTLEIYCCWDAARVDLRPSCMQAECVTAISSAQRRLPRWSELSPLLRPKPLELQGDRRRAAAAASVHDLRTIAQRRVPRAVFDYVDGGAESELSLRDARSSLEGVRFAPRTLRDVSDPDPSTEILGVRSPIPVVFAPTGFTRMMHSAGELAVARAAGAAGITYALSTMGTTSLEDVAAEIPGCRRWFQLYVWRDRGRSLDLIQRAAAAGYDALILTVDTVVPGARLRDVRNGMTIPPALVCGPCRWGAAPALVVQPAHDTAVVVRVVGAVERDRCRARLDVVRPLDQPR